GEAELASQLLRGFGRVHGEGGDLHAELPEIQIPVPVLRQLAEAEGSPAAPVEDQHQGSVCRQRGKAARRPDAVRQGEVRGSLTGVRWTGIGHGSLLLFHWLRPEGWRRSRRPGAPAATTTRNRR